MTWTQRWIVASIFLLRIALTEAQPIPSPPIAFDIPSQPLDTALTEFAHATGLQLLVLSDTAHEHIAPNVSGSLTADSALAKLLENSGLAYHFVNARTVAISQADGAARSTPGESPRSQPASASRTGRPGNLDALNAPRAAVPEVLIEGSQTLNMDIERTRDDIQPYVVFDREQLKQSGAINIEEFLRQRLPMNAQTSALAQQPSQVGNASSINLRGLGTNQTLILVDGHRRASFGASGVPQQPDLNGIPLYAVERIEVLPTTASGIYGGSATGGAINIILRRDYSGLETRLTYENPFEGGGANRRIDLHAGYNTPSGRTNLLFAGSYVDAASLPVADREFLQRGRDRIVAQNPAFFFSSPVPPLGRTSNIRSVTGANLTLKAGGALNSSVTFVPEGYAGPDTDLGAALLSNAGRYNLELAETAQLSGGANAGLLNSPTIESVATTVRHEFTNELRAFLELAASNNTGYFRTNNIASTFLVPRTAALNPFNQDIRVTTPAFGGDGLIVASNHVRRAVGGAIVRLPRDWYAEADYTFERTRFTSTTPGTISATAAGAVASGTLNVLRDTNSFETDFASFVNPPTYQSPVHTTLKDASVRFAGPLFSLPGGAVNVATLLEHRDEILGSQRTLTGGPVSVVTLNPGKSQSVDSVYLELRLPLIGERNARRGVRELELQLAGRHDRYETDGSNVTQSVVTRATNRVHSTDPTFGVRYAPARDVTFRASYGTGFVPPGVTDLVPAAPLSIPGNLLGLFDPRRGGEPVGGAITVLSGGNPDLTPEQSESHSVGVVFTPRWVSALRFSVDWTRIEKDSEITNIPITQSSLDSEGALPSGVISRAAPAAGDPFGVGRITGWNTRRLNIARKTVEAYDVSLDYVRVTENLGTFQIFGIATRQTRFDVQTISGSPVEDRTGLVTALEWRGSAGINWKYRSWTLGWNSRYLDAYWANPAHTVSAVQGASQVSSQMYHDVFINWVAPASLGETVFAQTEVQIGVKNLFDQQPPFDATNLAAVGGNLYSPLGDPRLRSYLISVKKQF